MVVEERERERESIGYKTRGSGERGEEKRREERKKKREGQSENGKT